MSRRFACLGVLLSLVAAFASAPAAAEETDPEISFQREIQPLLARNCFACHGPDDESREAGLRLDRRASAIEAEAILPGKPDESPLIARVEADDPDLRMPPAEHGQPLGDEEQQVLRRWIAAGAKYEQHWAFLPPTQPPLPAVQRTDWPRNEVDRFVLARIEQAGMSPAPEADKYALVRRLYLDLIGLPPTIEEADAFVRSDDPRAYEKLVDELLKSPHYGERWAQVWLDLARYADTNGYEKDRPRSIWPYRDWVIRAINADMPYDQFTIEQLAGDMLPNATTEQRIATGFHRNTMLNEEGGIDPLEYRFYAMVDRVATTGTVWMGLTTGCAQCHSHKYDPISHTDYYRLLALLNNADEPDLLVPDASTLAERREIEGRIERLEHQLAERFPPAPGAGDGAGDVDERRKTNLRQKLDAFIATQAPRAADWQILRPAQLETNLPRLELLPDGSIFSTGDITKRDVFQLTFDLDRDEPITAIRLEALPDDRLPARGPGRAYYEGRKGDFFLSEVSARVDGAPVKFKAGSHNYGKISIGSGTAAAANVFDGDGSTGWSTAGREGEASQLVLILEKPLPARGKLELELLFERHFAASLGRFRLSATDRADAAASDLPVEIEGLLARDAEDWTAAERAAVQRHFLRTTPELAGARREIDALRRRLPQLPVTMVLRERPADNPRATHRHHRGEYLSPREAVDPGIPAVFAGLTAQPPKNRLQFARWLVSKGNPLAARVAVNRAWRAFFGAGLVRTSGDFGTQSEPPTHPGLLDWLAVDFMEHGWSLKRLHRQIVLSATYRQQSHAAPADLERDPGNRLLARGARFRVDAEILRDLMLAASGRLSKKMHGPSVFPPQPASVTGLAYGSFPWKTSPGEDRYRRSLYTFRKRTTPFAAYATFDAPSGEVCLARRDRSNTPLQALVLLNDEMFLDFARGLAELAMRETPAEPQSRARFIFRRVLTRPPTEHERQTLLDFYAAQRQRLVANELDAQKIVGRPTATADHAACVLLARAIMNLDEAVVRP